MRRSDLQLCEEIAVPRCAAFATPPKCGGALTQKSFFLFEPRFFFGVETLAMTYVREVIFERLRK